ncbi:DUF2834 domain-containing protein [Oscillatoria sp. FACHB-1407]|uniref:DUF2834 domain-containing protein n=1 Tax=Oscillatoria sp. FACHB-1407 TaxID=2692847 RepID=UPI0016841944|nr:DUF2834 domain-containing protein [Oscillatoria sp. FACHB-1407]MBD2464611.1 DUF2834 domain-containing protein [Oscillatoria sp. FACHB-1407]
MLRKTILWLIWVTFSAYTIVLAPLDQSETWVIGWRLLAFQWHKLNAFIPAIFWLMGVVPMLYAGLMFADGRMQPFRAWTYFVGANFTGVICLLPYLIVRHRNQEFQGKKDEWLSILDRRSTGVVLLALAVFLVGYGAIAGDWNEYVQLFQTTPFVHLISLDFCLICLIFPITSLFDDDLARRGLTDARIFWAVACFPLLGPLLYLCFRPPLNEDALKIYDLGSIGD